MNKKQPMYLLPWSYSYNRVLFIINFVLLRYSFWKFSFILLSLILLYSKIPRYWYRFFTTSLIISPSGISTPLDHTTFPLFNRRTPHFFIPNSILISLLNICTVETNPFTSDSTWCQLCVIFFHWFSDKFHNILRHLH